MRTDFENWIAEHGWDEWDGDADAPTGAFGYFEFTAEDLTEFKKTSDETPEVGWYFHSLNNQGIITYNLLTSEWAEEWFRAAQEIYYEWAHG